MRELYELRFNYEDPRLGQFDFKNEEHSFFGNSLLIKDFDANNSGKLSWQPPKLSGVWTPQEVVGAVPAFCDYTTIGNIPVMSRRAVAVLRDLLEPCGELLPLCAATGAYFAFNILSVSDAFDRERGEADFAPETSKETAFGIDRFEFHEDRLSDDAIFCIREYPQMEIVDDRFSRRVEQSGLIGFCFNKIWPLPPDVSWEDLALKQKRQRKREGQVGELRRQGVEIRLSISDAPQDGDEPSDQDCQRAEAIIDALTAAIEEKSKESDGEFIAVIEANEPGPNGVIVTLACPNAKQTFATIEPTLKASNWPHRIAVDLVHGNPFDQSTKIETVQIPR